MKYLKLSHLLVQPTFLRQEDPGNADDPHVVQLQGVLRSDGYYYDLGTCFGS